MSADNKVTVKRQLRRSEVLGFFRKLLGAVGIRVLPLVSESTMRASDAL